MNVKRAIVKTISLSVILSLIGLWASGMFNTPSIFALLFGLAIPLANWNSLGSMKLLKLLVICVTTVSIFFVGLALGFVAADSELYFLALIISGTAGTILLLVHSNLLSNIQANFITHVVTFIFCFAAIPFGHWIVNLIVGKTNSDVIFIFWTFLFTLGVVTGLLQNKSTVNNRLS